MTAYLKNTLLAVSTGLWATILPACGQDSNDTSMDGGESLDTSDTGTGTGGTDTGFGDTGETDTGGDDAPFAASCADQALSGVDYEYSVCGEYFYEADDALELANQTACSIVGGTWSTERCVTDGSVGSCTTDTVTTIVNYYFDIPESEISSRQSTCEGLGGTWTAL